MGVVFPLPPTGLKPLGRPLLEKSNTLRPVRCGAQRTLAARRQQQYSRGVATFLSPKPGPPSPGPLFFVFVFPLPPAGFRPLGRPLSERSKTDGPAALASETLFTMRTTEKNKKHLNGCISLGRHFLPVVLSSLGGIGPPESVEYLDRLFAETYATERRLGGSGSETQHQRTIFYQTLQAILATKSTIMIQTLSNYTPPQSHGGTPLPPPINPLTHPTAPQTNTTASTHPQSPPHSPTQQPPSHDSGPTTHRRSSRISQHTSTTQIHKISMYHPSEPWWEHQWNCSRPSPIGNPFHIPDTANDAAQSAKDRSSHERSILHSHVLCPLQRDEHIRRHRRISLPTGNLHPTTVQRHALGPLRQEFQAHPHASPALPPVTRPSRSQPPTYAS